jgi:hypothetical protein
MQTASRKIAFGLLAAFALLATGTGCGSSNNKGKITGKWKITGGTDMKPDDMKMMEAFKLVPYMEFKDDGTVSFGVDTTDPDMKKLMEKGGEKTAFSFKYKLGSGDDVELYDLPKDLQDKKGGGSPWGKKDRAKCSVKIEGDNMTIIDDEKKDLKLTKMK